jgi:hypothetical protein
VPPFTTKERDMTRRHWNLAFVLSLAGCTATSTVGMDDAGRADAYRPPVGRYDECGNGLDDDGDGAIDEDCPCGTGETQPCWDGARAARGVGACGDGVQQCSAAGSDEFGRWLSCTMSRGPDDSESCEGSTDEDCDGAIDEGCTCTEGASRACTGPSEGACSAGAQSCRGGTWTACEGAVGPVAEVCGNGLDDDCDGMSDDPSFCSCSPVPEVCGNGADDDCDGTSDETPCAMPTPDAGTPDAGMPDTEDAGSGEPCADGLHRVGARCVADGGVRPIAPISLSDTTLRSPTLRFELPAGADGAVIELCRERACATVIETLRVTGTSARPSAPLPASSVVFWRARARVGASEDTLANNGPTWLFHTPARDNSGGIDTSYNPHLDVNGDGFDDVLVGAPSCAGDGCSLPGTASLYHGSAAGVGVTAALVLEGAAEEDRFGGAVACAGDVNGDGFADIVVGSHLADPGGRVEAGTASVFHGSAIGVTVPAARVLEGVSSREQFGESVAGAGDVDGDGFADIIVGSPSADPGGRLNGGEARVFHGSATGVSPAAARVVEGSGMLGGSVASAGDINGDGFTDVVIGAPWTTVGDQALAGTASVLHGSPTGLDPAAARVLVLEGAAMRDFFGWVVASAGDINGDGFADILVGAPQNEFASDGFGKVSVHLGSAMGIAPEAARVLEGAPTGAYRFGAAAAGAGDVNGDGFADIIIGAYAASPGGRRGAGSASVFHGSAMGVAASADRVLEGAARRDSFGRSAASAGDVNGDGFADVVVGAPVASPGGRTEAGAASVFRGSAAGTAPSPATVLEGADVKGYFGDAVASARNAEHRSVDGRPGTELRFAAA